MAKKKVAAHSHHQRQKDSNDSTTHHPQHHEVSVKYDGPVIDSEPMEQKIDPSEKIQNLKSLNSLLLKETFERRQHVESLELAKAALEAELTQYRTDNRGLETELLFVTRQNAALEMEKAVVCVFLETRLREIFAQVGTLKGHWAVEILGFREKVGELSASLENERALRSHVTRERDSLKSDCDTWMKKANGMRENLNEIETVRRDLEERFDILTVEHGKLREEKREGTRALELAVQEGDSVRSDLRAAAEEIGSLNRKIDELDRENKGIIMEKSAREVKIKELEKEIVMLKEDVKSLGKEEKKLQDMVVELGKRSLEASEKEIEMSRQIESLVEVGKEKEASIERVKAEKESWERLLKISRKELEEKRQMMEGMVREKNEIKEVNYINQSEIGKLQNEMAELRNELAALQISCGNETEKNWVLVSEINKNKEALHRVSLERDSVKKGLSEERRSGVSLRLKITELENKIEEGTVVLGKLMSEHDELKIQMESYLKRFEKVRKEKDLLKEKLLDAQKSITKLKCEIEIASAKYDRALIFVRDMALSLLNEEKKQIIVAAERGVGLVGGRPTKDETDVEAYVKELDMIKSVFQRKASMVEELMRQIDHMQGDIDKEKKSKNLWTLVSSATTLVAAVLVAYLARAR